MAMCGHRWILEILESYLDVKVGHFNPYLINLESTNGTNCFVVKEQEFYQKCSHFEHLTSKTFRLVESETSVEATQNHRYAHIYISEKIRFVEIWMLQFIRK